MRSQWPKAWCGESIEVAIVAVAPGEKSKAVEVAAGLWEGMLELGADRKTVVVAVGGGVVGDLAGFIAATFARGLRFLQIPTTLLAQVDSSVGGKVGINLSQAKNMVGAFLQPLGVLIDTATLDTLPKREYVSGLAEVLKYGVILDAEFFADLEADAAKLVARDPADADPRDCPQLPAEGRRGREGRARGDRPAGRLELWPHLRPCLRGPDRLRRTAARRGGEHRHDVCRPAGPAAGPGRCGLCRPAAGPHRNPGPADQGRRNSIARRSWPR